MAVRSAIAAFMLSGLTLTAARQHVRRANNDNIYLNSSRISSDAPQPPSTFYPEFSFEPGTTTSSPSPAATLSLPLPTSTLALPSHQRGLLPVGPGSRPFPSQTGTPTSGVYPQSGFSFDPTTTKPSADQGCGGTTLNVLNATLDWWWTSTALNPVSKLSFLKNDEGEVTGWTISNIATDFDASTVVSTDACDPSPYFYTYVDFGTNDTETVTGTACSQVQGDVAAATSAVTVRAWVPVNRTTGTSFDDVPKYKTLPPPAEATVAGVNTTFGTDSPFVYFSAYQLVSGNATTKANGDEVCNFVTKTYNMSKPYAFSYTDQDPASSTIYPSVISGDLDPYLATAIGQPQVVLGSFTAVPTVVVVVDEVYAYGAVVAFAGTAFTASQLDVPTAVLPAGVSISTSDDAGAVYTSLTASPRIEVTQKVLLVPGPDTTSTVPIVVVQSLIQDTTSSSPSSSPQNVGSSNHMGGDNNGWTKPSDALDVLTQAVGPFIMQGLGDMPTPAQTTNIAGATATISTVSGFAVDGQTAVAGGPAITADGKVISVPSGGKSIVVDGSTIVGPGAGDTITTNGVQITEVPVTVYAVAGQTLLPGGSSIMIAQTPVALAPGGGAIIVGSSTSMLQTRVITVGTETVTANAATQFVFGSGQTLTPGGSIVIRGTTLSLASGGSAVVVNGHTTPIAVQANPTAGVLVPLTIDGHTITGTAGVYVVSGQTLNPGGAITFTGSSGPETVSLDRSGNVMVDIMSGKSTTTTMQAGSPVITLGGQTFTAQAGSSYVINGQTLTPGGVRTVVVSSTTYVLSLAATPTVLEIEQIDANGRTTATTYETLTTASTSPGSGTKLGSPTSTSLSSEATSIETKLASTILACCILAFTVWL